MYEVIQRTLSKKFSEILEGIDDSDRRNFM